jgi:hypothetical protein
MSLLETINSCVFGPGYRAPSAVTPHEDEVCQVADPPLIESKRRTQIGSSRDWLVETIAARGPIRQATLAEQHGGHYGAMLRMLATLEHEGSIRRVQRPGIDKRNVWWGKT